MADVATLGIAVNSQQVKSAEQDLSRFEAAAKRAGVSVQEMQRRSQATSERMAALRARTQAASTQLSTYSTQATAASAATQRLAVSSGAATVALTRLAGSLITGFAGAQGYTAIRRAVDEVARIGETAEKVGVSARELQVFRHAIDMAGGDAAQADRAMESFARKLAEAGNSAGDLYKVFQANGQALSGSVSRDFRSFLDLLSRTRNEQDRLAIAQKIFGEDIGRNVVSALAKGSAGFDEYARQADRVGILTDDQIKKARELDGKFTELERSASAALKTIAVDAAPGLLSVLQAISRVVKDLSYDFSLLRQGNFKDVIGLYTSVAERDAATRRRQLMTGGQSGQLSLSQSSADAFYGAVGLGSSGTTSRGRGTVNPFGNQQRERLNDYERATKAITRRTEALGIEAHTFNMTESAAAKYRATQELINAAQMAGIKITPQMSQEISVLAERYAEVTERLEQLRDRQEAIDFLKDSTKSLLQDFSSSLREGASAWEAFREAGANALERISQKLIDMAVNDLFSKAFGGNQGFGFGSLMNAFGGGSSGNIGGTGGILGGLYHSGGIAGQPRQTRYIHPAYFDDAPRYHNGGIAGLKPNEVPAILERGERVIPNGAGMSVSPVFNVQADPGQDPMRAIRAYVNSPAFEADWVRQSKKARDGRKA